MLSDVKIRKAQPGEKDAKFSDEKGLYLLVRPNGSKLWRVNYRFAGKAKTLALGVYPEVSLSEARARRDEARALLRDNVDPGLEKKRRASAAKVSAGNTFRQIAEDWRALHGARWSESNRKETKRTLEKDVYPAIGALPIAEIDAPMVLDLLRAVERRGSIDGAKRLRQKISAVFVHAISISAATSDPAAAVQKALKPGNRKKRQPALTALEDLRTFLSDTDATGSSAVTLLASRLLALTAVRSGVVTGARWTEFKDIDGPEPFWHIPAERMKLDLDRKDEAVFDHIVPLAPAAVEVVKAVQPLTGRGKLLFPNRSRSDAGLSRNALIRLYKTAAKGRWKGRHVPHGWRASFSTVMNERAIDQDRPGDRQVIDLMLAHVPTNTVESAYNRAQFMTRRREIACEWAALLMEGMKPAADLVELSTRRS